MTTPEWAMLIALASIWGGSFFFNGVAVRELPVFTVVVSRLVLAALILGVLFLDESLLPKHMAGMALIGIGLAAIDGRPWRAASRLRARAVEERR